MSLTGLLVHDVTIVHPATITDRYDNDLSDWTNATRTTSKGWISQRSTSEVLGNRQAAVADWVAYLPADTTIDNGDRIEWQGATFEVDGPPNHAWTPRGEHHLEVALHSVEG